MKNKPTVLTTKEMKNTKGGGSIGGFAVSGRSTTPGNRDD